MPDRQVESDRSEPVDPMTTATAEMFLRQRDDAMEAWKARGRELNELYDTLTAIVDEPAPGMDPVADLKALGAQRDRLRAALAMVRENAARMQEAGDRLTAENEALKDAIDSALQTTWTQDEEGGWGTSEDRLHVDRFAALEALQPHWQAWGDGAWHASGRDAERAHLMENENEALRAEVAKLRGGYQATARPVVRGSGVFDEQGATGDDSYNERGGLFAAQPARETDLPKETDHA